nr:uncharacterized protein LOC125631836 [Caretta caretta]
MAAQGRRRAPAFSVQETLDLIALWGEEPGQAERYAQIAQRMGGKGYTRDSQQCRVKIKALVRAYLKTRMANSCPGAEPQTCRFYEQLHAILDRDFTGVPVFVVDSSRVATGNSEEDTVDEEEEEEEEENVQQASRGSILSDNQDLFLTRVPAPSQDPLLQDCDGGEGTSAANVSTLPLSSPSQRLARIKRQKNRTRDEMFSELMQASRAARAQQNAWRQTMAESLKAENECQKRWRERVYRRQDAMLRLMREQTDILRRLVELQERQQEHRPPLQPLCNHPPSSPSSIASSP